MAGEYTLKKLTDLKWLNLYEATYRDKFGRQKHWTVASRKRRPVADADRPDAVVIVAVVEAPGGKRLVVTREFRVPVWDYEYGFPAGLIEEGQAIEDAAAQELRQETGLELVKIKHISSPVYSSSGMTDESACMVFVEAKGQVSDEHLEDSERIETLLMDVEDIRRLVGSGKKISAKAWGLFYHYAKTGGIC
jgi:ADP-ribose pyrophosphatase